MIRRVIPVASLIGGARRQQWMSNSMAMTVTQLSRGTGLIGRARLLMKVETQPVGPILSVRRAG